MEGEAATEPSPCLMVRDAAFPMFHPHCILHNRPPAPPYPSRCGGAGARLAAWGVQRPRYQPSSAAISLCKLSEP